ncbi:hypothetical protein [Neorhizobium sp. DAR64861/K0K2]|uniref:hypothetical protein n=1 Tax=unclassified Neorhizobium TaxID=2629175 RepID=UPI003D2E64B5
MNRIIKVRLAVVTGSAVFVGAAAGAALYLAPHLIPGNSAETAAAMQCSTVKTIRSNDKDGTHVRTFLAVGPMDEAARMRTALRVAKALHEAEKPHLIQVAVLDEAGPTTLAEMRGPVIGARLTFIAKATNDAEIKAGPFSGYAIQGSAGSDGRFYGARQDFNLADFASMTSGLGELSDCKPDPTEPVVQNKAAAPPQADEVAVAEPALAAPAH